MLPEGETLCAFFVPSHHHHEDENETEEEEEAHHHFVLSSSGSLYLFDENSSEALEQAQPPVALEGVDNITDCSQASIVQYGDEGVLVFVGTAQKLFMVDSHGLDFHQHSQWDLKEFLPGGFVPQYMTGLGEGAEHDHDHE